MQKKRRIIIGISGASGVIMGSCLLEALKEQGTIETHLIMTESAKTTWDLETDIPIESLYQNADVIHDSYNLAASVSSGSFRTDGMIIIPCSMKSLAGVVSGYTDNLLLRAADVCLKENRKLVLVPREMPLGKVHIRNLKEASDLGCIIVPPLLTFYNQGDGLKSQIEHIVGKILMQFDIDYAPFQAWKGVSHE